MRGIIDDFRDFCRLVRGYDDVTAVQRGTDGHSLECHAIEFGNRPSAVHSLVTDNGTNRHVLALDRASFACNVAFVSCIAQESLGIATGLR